MLRSFRLKIGLLSLCLSGLLLLGFGLFAVSALNRLGIDRIDRELRVLADAQVRRSQVPGHWRVFEGSLRSVYGEDAARTFVVRVNRPNGEQLYSTANWPDDLPRNALPLPLAGLPRDAPRDTEGKAPPPPRSDEPRDRPPRPSDEHPPRPLPVQGPVYATLGGADGGWRAMTMANEEVSLSIAMRLSGLRTETRRFQKALLVAVPLGLLLIVAGGWLLGHVALQPVNRIVRLAKRVTARQLDERVPGDHADEEFKRLIDVMNGMLDRLERSFQQATRFSADAAHELKTPLAILQAQTERSLQRAPDGSAEQRESAEQLEEVQRLKAILAKLLLLSQADSGRLPLSHDRVNLAELARAAAEDARILAPDRDVGVEAPEALFVTGDTILLNQVFENLVSNAVKFGDKQGSIRLRVEALDGHAVFSITNSGRPISTSDQDKVFERFFRGDQSHGRAVEGTGLGLSLAREIARAHGGDLVLERSDAQGTLFRLILPLSCPMPAK